MISIQAIRDDPDAVKRAIARKGESSEVIDRLLEADSQRRELLAAADAAKHERNEGSRQVGEYVRAGQTAEAEARKASLAS
ncbi:MAG TPA: serine--tRNA ligase, partial [Candidatus Limnocylindria bacterium]|nr:serine--tRNA ligase [Candidatus Limnocylindria bacterium]